MNSTENKILVSSHGYGDASIFFLQGFPLKEDLKNGLALSGYNESTINHFLKQNRLHINQCYRACFIKEQLEYSGTNPKKQKTALSKVDVAGYEALLLDEIKNVNPNIIVPLDDLSLSAVFPHINSIRKPKGRKYWIYCYRGSILPLRTDWQVNLPDIIRIIPTLGPQTLVNDWTARSYTGLDYIKIAKWQHARSPIEEEGLIWIAKDASSLYNFLKRSFEENPKRLTSDIETWMGFPQCISLCFNGKECCVVPLYDPLISQGELVLMWRLVARLLRHPIEKNGQNFKYDWTINERWGLLIENVKSDTLLKTSLIYPELAKGLDFLTSIYTDNAYYKDEGKEYNPRLHTRDRLYIYCGKDSLNTHIIAEKQDVELEEAGVKELYDTEFAPSIIIYKNLDITGIKIDRFQKLKLLEKYSNLYALNLTKLRVLTNNQKLNPKSPRQVGIVIYEDLKFPIHYKTNEEGRKTYKTDKETLDDLYIHHAERIGPLGSAIIARVIVCRKLAKVIEYIETPLHPDNRFRGCYNLAGTETGRSSCSKTIDERLRFEHEMNPNQPNRAQKLGRSLQTISKQGFSLDEDIFDDFESHEIAKDLRSMFIPSRNCIFIEGDGNSAEARIVAVLAEDWELLESLDKKPKIHAKTIGMILGIDPNTITKDHPSVPKLGMPYYELGKRIRHAGHNGMRAGRLAQYTHMSLKECTILMEKFHSTNPKINNVFHNTIRQLIENQSFLVCPNGRRRDFFARHDDSLNKEALCYIQQATISDLTKFSMHRIASQLPGYMEKYAFLAEMHDGILAEVHKDNKNEYIDTFKKIYERPIDFRNCSLSRDIEVTVPCEISIAEDNWMNLKEIKL